jgi:hypothetical protein
MAGDCVVALLALVGAQVLLRAAVFKPAVPAEIPIGLNLQIPLAFEAGETRAERLVANVRGPAVFRPGP